MIMAQIRYPFRSLEDFLISHELSADGVLDDGGGVLFPVKGKEIQASVLFADITAFSRRTLSLSSTETLAFVNLFFTWITAEAARVGPGIVDKYIGDEIMIVFSEEFGSQDAFTDAVRTAICIGGHDPLDFSPHVGIASGIVTIGFVGTPVKYNCSAFGAPIALAARCAGVLAQEAVSSSIFFPSECLGNRSFADLVPNRATERPRWKMLPPRKENLKNIGETEVIEIAKLTCSVPFGFSAESFVKEGIDALRKTGRYRPLTP
jgi:class 3 adenylate cyclase